MWHAKSVAGHALKVMRPVIMQPFEASNVLEKNLYEPTVTNTTVVSLI